MARASTPRSPQTFSRSTSEARNGQTNNMIEDDAASGQGANGEIREVEIIT